MKALILNSGIGKRMGNLTLSKPKCMVRIGKEHTILSWQLHLLQEAGIKEVVVTTGPFEDVLRQYVESLQTGLTLEYVLNPDYQTTNYIYSIECAKENLDDDDILLLHGDLVMEASVIHDLIVSKQSSITVDKSLPLPEKDFKAYIENARVMKVGIEFFGEGCVACQPAYHITRSDMAIWLKEINTYCSTGRKNVYAENALNDKTDEIFLYPLELDGRLCCEIDNEEDLVVVSKRFVSVTEKEN